MSLRSKVIGTLLCAFILYALAAWLALEFVYTSAFDRLERDSASDQLNRISKYLEAERADVDLLVVDWAQWDDTMEYVLGDYEEYYEENLVDSYLNELGMGFGAIIDTEGGLKWGEVYLADESIAALDYLFPEGIQQGSVLLNPVESGELVSGLINTAQGPAIVSSAAILWNSGEGSPGGHMIVGKLLDADRMEVISRTMLTPIDIVPVKHSSLPQQFHQAHDELLTGEEQYAIVKHEGNTYALSLLRDIADKQLGLLRVAIPADISNLGASTLHTTISTLIIAALVLTLTLWVALKGMLLVPIEHLTAVLRGKEGEHTTEESGKYLLSTVQRLTDSRGVLSKRNDEIGELVSAFDDLSFSLRKATTSIWRVAHLDGLTHLANRRLFMERLTRGIDCLGDNSNKITVMFIDLDDFKIVNDLHGHDTGDQLLIDVANRLQSVIGSDQDVISPEDDTTSNLVARIGGDEFVILLPSQASPDHANDIATRIVEAISSTFVVDGKRCHIGACVGIAVYPDDADDVSAILSNADSAMYEAKRAGKSCWLRYTPDLGSMPKRKSA